MRHILRLLWHGDPEALARAKAADEQADKHLDQARKNGKRTDRILVRNSLSERFIREIRENHA